MTRRPPIYGILAEFRNPENLVRAAEAAYAAGYRRMDAYSPAPIEGLAHALGFRSSRLPWIILLGGLIGAASGYLLQYYISVVDYPLNVGGKPLHSWPAFIPVTFEVTILVASLFAVLGMLGLNGLPEPYHPLFNIPSFELASRNHFFLCIEATDPQFNRDATKSFLQGLGPHDIQEVRY